VPVPAARITAANTAAVRTGGDYVLFWMIAARRTRWNFALDRALEWCTDLGKPLVVLEALRCDYPWASDRLHRFVMDGMADNAKRLDRPGIRYVPYLEPEPGAGRGLLAALAARACAVVTDEFPCFFLPHMVRAAAAHLDVRLEAVDGNGLLPLRATDRAFLTAYSFRRHLQNTLRDHAAAPRPDSLARLDLPDSPTLPRAVTSRWKPATAAVLAAGPGAFPVDHTVPPSPLPGGETAARTRLREFVRTRLEGYADHHNDFDPVGTSGLSPYLHFGHVSAHEVFRAVTERERWSFAQCSSRNDGRRAGWWNLSPGAEAFLDQLVTWRELGYNMCFHREDYADYDSLPPWARETLRDHETDSREHVYDLPAFENAATHDPLWNAAQRQLRREGVIHNYLRMVWGKKILEWTASPREALAIMIELNNKYGLDGRNPNSYSGIFWCLGRYDRPWGPERAIFGKIRYMSSENTARKLRVAPYLERYGDDAQATLF